MATSPSPEVANWELVLRLRERRGQLGLTANDITQTLGFTRNYWSAIENERKIIPENTLRSLFDILEFGNTDRQQLLTLRATAKESGWWSHYSALLDHEIQRFYALEHGAEGVRDYETLLIPGLLQTADYARAVMSSDATIRPVEVEQRVAIRLRRQELLHGDDPLQLTVVMSEAALRQQIGGTAVLRTQLQHLLTIIEQQSANVEIRVIPFSATACNLFGAGTLQLLDFHSARLPRVAWVETVSTWGVITHPTRVRDMSMAFTEALERTLDRQRSKDKINTLRKDLR
jgi:transcriptional regulator with XRE-family HTH domain